MHWCVGSDPFSSRRIIRVLGGFLICILRFSQSIRVITHCIGVAVANVTGIFSELYCSDSQLLIRIWFECGSCNELVRGME